MTQLHEILDPAELILDRDQGFIRSQTHPVLPYTIHSYTEKATHERHWTQATRTCRGLIVNHETLKVIARPFPKFFNFDEPLAPSFSPADIVSVHDKLDGSLGILYSTPSGPAIATRGSFTSPQALHATALLRSKYPSFYPSPNLTHLFEIVYPENRIVLDYGARDDLILLGIVENFGGHVYDASASRAEVSSWPGPKAETLIAHTRFDAIPPSGFHRSNAEGVVILRFSDSAMIKIKQPDYVALHRIVTNLSEKTVWRHLGSGAPLDSLLSNLPEEFYPWVTRVASDLTVRAASLRRDLEHDFIHLCYQFSSPLDRRLFAREASKHPSSWALFALLDSKDIRPEIWKRLEPKGIASRPTP